LQECNPFISKKAGLINLRGTRLPNVFVNPHIIVSHLELSLLLYSLIQQYNGRCTSCLHLAPPTLDASYLNAVQVTNLKSNIIKPHPASTQKQHKESSAAAHLSSIPVLAFATAAALSSRHNTNT
jgi:hypothetical protein